MVDSVEVEKIGEYVEGIANLISLQSSYAVLMG